MMTLVGGEYSKKRRKRRKCRWSGDDGCGDAAVDETVEVEEGGWERDGRRKVLTRAVGGSKEVDARSKVQIQRQTFLEERRSVEKLEGERVERRSQHRLYAAREKGRIGAGPQPPPPSFLPRCEAQGLTDSLVNDVLDGRAEHKGWIQFQSRKSRRLSCRRRRGRGRGPKGKKGRARARSSKGDGRSEA